MKYNFDEIIMNTPAYRPFDESLSGKKYAKGKDEYTRGNLSGMGGF